MKRIACRLPAMLKAELDWAVEQNGYGPKGTSRWIREALDQLFRGDPDLLHVGLSEDLSRNDVEITCRLEDHQLQAINTAVIKLRAQDPFFEGVQSAVLRAAIRWRLRQNAGLLRSPQ